MHEKDNREKFMQEAIDLSIENITSGGGPFGAVIVRNGEIVARSGNRVVPDCDPTAHAEVMAIRKAARALETFDLSGCEIYTSCEPCPMCLSAIYWARIDRIYYGNDKTDAEKAGFDDSFIYRELAVVAADRRIPAVRLMPEKALEAFRLWTENPDKTAY